MSVHQMPLPRRETRGINHIWGDRVSGFVVTHESESGNSWGEMFDYATGQMAITAAFALNRDQYDGVCAVNICDAAVEDTSPGVGSRQSVGGFLMATRMDPAMLRDMVEDVRARFPVSRVVDQGVKLIRAANEWKACCPFHADKTPSFTVYKGDTRWQCFAGCGGGDVLDYVQRRHGVGLIEAVRMLDAGALPVVERPGIVTSDKDAAAYIDAARRIWQRACEVREETPAYRYLASRALGGPVPPVLRFARLRCKIMDGDNGPRRPALVALVVDVAGEPIGVQRTYLTDEGRKAFGKDSKLSLGQVKRGAIRLAPASGEVCLAEGMETALSLQHMSGVPTWASAGSTMLPAMVLPDDIRSVTIGADADPAGERTAQEAARVFTSQGRAVHIARPAAGFGDFNDEHQAEAQSGNRY